MSEAGETENTLPVEAASSTEATVTVQATDNNSNLSIESEPSNPELSSIYCKSYLNLIKNFFIILIRNLSIFIFTSNRKRLS
jgi:hypothetical protein